MLMNDLYMFLVMSVTGEPPNGDKMKAIRDSYIFAPFGGSQIFTIDADLWKIGAHNPEQFFCPSTNEYNAIVGKSINSNTHILVGLIAEHELNVPGRGLTSLEVFMPNDKYSMMVDMGYDVIDYFGLSAIANIGYTPNEVINIGNMDIDINRFGLINNKDDGIRFALFSNASAKEHSPFFPIRVKAINIEVARWLN